LAGSRERKGGGFGEYLYFYFTKKGKGLNGKEENFRPWNLIIYSITNARGKGEKGGGGGQNMSFAGVRGKEGLDQRKKKRGTVAFTLFLPTNRRRGEAGKAIFRFLRREEEKKRGEFLSRFPCGAFGKGEVGSLRAPAHRRREKTGGGKKSHTDPIFFRPQNLHD